MRDVAETSSDSNFGVSVLTIVKGRQQQLQNQLRGLVQLEQPPDEWVVVGMGESAESTLADLITDLSVPFPVRFATVAIDGRHELPLAEARNLAAHVARHPILVFLDVDCIPAPEMLTEFCNAQQHRVQLWMGTPLYLPAGAAEGSWSLRTLTGKAVRHPKIPSLEPTQRIDQHAYEMFWSLCFCVAAGTFRRIGGFDESFAGYGAEDTDFAFAARDADVPFGLIGGRVFHQYHSVCKPPLNHFESILINARRFREKWGCWPMESWLNAFDDRGLVEFSTQHDVLETVRSPSRQEIAEAVTETPAGF